MFCWRVEGQKGEGNKDLYTLDVSHTQDRSLNVASQNLKLAGSTLALVPELQ